MMMTINISLPRKMYEDTKRLMKKKHYASISEFVRDAIRKELHPKLTGNGFTPEFEKQVLEAAAEPMDDDIVLETQEDIDKYFHNVHKRLEKKRQKKRNAKN